MKCLNEDQLIRLYYGDMHKDELSKTQEHIGACSVCRRRLNEIKALLMSIDTRPVSVSSDEINALIDTVKKEVGRQSLWHVLKENINDTCDALRLGFSYKPQLIPIIAVLIVALTVIPFKWHETALLDQEFDILQLEMEISFETGETSLFELYQNDSLLLDDFSGTGQARTHV